MRAAPRPLHVFLAALVVAALLTRPYAGGWNDGSRFATAESLVDRHTWVIDDSLLVHPPAQEAFNPYGGNDPISRVHGTWDKLFIDGHYYSDKSPVPSAYLAGWYVILKLCGLDARQHPRLFCYLLSLLSAGLAYAGGMACMTRLFVILKVEPKDIWLLMITLALGTMALAYVEHVNQHIFLFGTVAAMFCVILDRRTGLIGGSADEPTASRVTGSKMGILLLGALTGLSYTIDLGVGPVLVVTTGLLVAYRSRSIAAVATLAAGALPFMLTHHALNFRIGHTFKPANANLAYLLWPGSPFNAQNATGGWPHPTVMHFVSYMLDMLVGKKGFVPFNLLTVIAMGHAYRLMSPRFQKIRLRERPELVYAIALAVGTFLLYGATSNNQSGACISVRWFLPLLVPAYFVLALLLREHAGFARPQATVLAPFAMLIAALAAWVGPWYGHVPFPTLFWGLYILALVAWTGVTYSLGTEREIQGFPVEPLENARRPRN